MNEEEDKNKENVLYVQLWGGMSDKKCLVYYEIVEICN